MTRLAHRDDGPRPLRAGVYIRVSTRKQHEEGLSFPEQERRGRAYLTAKGWTLADVYGDVMKGRRDDRPDELLRMLADAERGALDVVVIRRGYRFGRSFRHSAELKGRLEDVGVRLVAMDMDVDFSTHAGLIIWANLSAIAEMESERIGERVADVAEAHARLGKVYGGRRPLYGYRRVQGQRGIFPHPEHRLTVVWIFEEAAAGTSPAEIAYRLNDRGVPTTDARKWDRSGIARLLRHPGYYGAVMHKGEVVCESGDHEPLVSRELWDRAQQAAVARKRLPASGGGRRPNGRHLLRGLLRCGICGRNLTTRTYKGTGRGAYYCPAERQERRAMPRPRAVPAARRGRRGARLLRSRRPRHGGHP